MNTNESDYTAQFVECQSKIKQILTCVPRGCQNWSYQKSVSFKKATKKCESMLKLRPSKRHADFINMENALKKLEQYYEFSS